VPSEKVAKWLLEEGYFPEQYIVPPTFKVSKFDLNPTPFIEVDTSESNPRFDFSLRFNNTRNYLFHLKTQRC
jgi:hypothetical protein